MGNLILLENHRNRRARGRADGSPLPATVPAAPTGANTLDATAGLLLPWSGTASGADARGRCGATPVRFVYDLACPFSYFAAERIERLFGRAEWLPAPASVPVTDALLARAEVRARELRLPLVWPDRGAAPVRRALRVGVLAAERGSGARFALAAARLAYCGGFDLDDPEILAEAAAAAGIPPADCLAAAADAARDRALEATAATVSAHGIAQLPAVGIGGRWFGGEMSLAGAMAARAAS